MLITKKIKTDMTDSACVAAALKAARADFDGNGFIVVRMAEHEFMLDTSTGRVAAPESCLATINRLRQLYAEARFRQEAAAQGCVIHSRREQPDGDILLVCSADFGGPGTDR